MVQSLRPLNVVLTAEHYVPRVGGAELVVKTVSEGLAKAGHDVAVLTSCVPGTLDLEELNGVQVYRFQMSGNAAKGIKGDPNAFVGALFGLKADVFVNYACQNWPTDLFMSVAHDIRAKKVLAPCGYSGLAGSVLRRALYSRYFTNLPVRLREYDAFVYHSDAYLDYEMGRQWGLSERAHVIPNGVALKEFSDVVPLADRTLSAVLVGNHYRIKGHRWMFKLDRSGVWRGDLPAAIVASSEGASGFQSCAEACRRKSKSSNILLLDGRSRRDVIHAIRHARLLIIASSIECAPLVALEAMAAGTPFVSFDVGNVSELPGGVVVPNFAAMEATIVAFAKDESLWDATSDAGRKASLNYDWPLIVGKWERVLLDLCSS